MPFPRAYVRKNFSKLGTQFNDFLHAYTTSSTLSDRNYISFLGKFIIGLSFHIICSHAFIYQHLIPFVRMHSFIIISYHLFTGLLDYGFIPLFHTHLLIVMLYHLFTRIFDYHFVPFLHMYLLIIVSLHLFTGFH